MTEHDDEIKPDREGIFWKRLRESLGGNALAPDL